MSGLFTFIQVQLPGTNAISSAGFLQNKAHFPYSEVFNHPCDNLRWSRLFTPKHFSISSILETPQKSKQNRGLQFIRVKRELQLANSQFPSL